MRLSNFISTLGIRKKLALLLLFSSLFFLITLSMAVVTPLLHQTRIKVITENQNELLTILQTEIDGKIATAASQLAAVAKIIPATAMTDAHQAQLFLENRVGITALFDNGLTLLTPDGTLLAETPYQPQRTEFNFSSYPLFQRLITSQIPTISAPFRSSKPPHHPVVQFCCPVRGDNGELIGLFSGALRLDGQHVIGSIAQHKIGKSGYLFLYDLDRTILAHPDRTRILQQDVPPGSNQLFDKALTGWEGTGFTVNSRGIETISSFRQLDNVPWILASNQPVNEAFIPSRNAATALNIIIGLLGTLFLGVVLFSLRSITTPLAALTSHLSRLEKLEGEQRLFLPAPGTSQEIQLLADNFNHMITTQDAQRVKITEKANQLQQQALALSEQIEVRRQTEKELMLISTKYLDTALLLQNICDNVPDLIWAKDLENRYLFTNRVNNETLLFPKTPDEPLGKTHDYFTTRILAGYAGQPRVYDFGVHCTDSDARTLASRKPMQFQENGYIFGKLVCLDVFKAPLYDVDGALIGTIGSARIVTREKQLEQETARLARLYRVLSVVNQYIVHKPGTLDLLQFVCDTLLKDGTFLMAWVGRQEKDHTSEAPTDRAITYQPLSTAGLPDEAWHSGFSIGCPLSAGKKLLPDINSDNYRDHLCPMGQKLYQHQSFKAIGCFPILPREATPLLLVLYTNDSDLLVHHDEQTLIDELVSNLAFALDVAEQDQRQIETLKELQVAATAFENSIEGVVVTDGDERIISVNRAFCEITGYSAEEVIGQTPRLIKSDRHGRDFYQALWQTLSKTGRWQGEIWNRRKNGQIYPERLSIGAVHDGQGIISHYVGVFSDVSQIKESEKQLDYLQSYDPLSDLPNRRMFSGLLTQAIELAKREGKSVALLCLDLDHFKDINDSFGFLAGDSLLQQMAKRLRCRVRTSDTVARLGADEFIVLLEGVTEQDRVTLVAQDLLHLTEQPFKLDSGENIQLSTSIGIALFPEHGDTALELLRKVDSALYLSKQRGRNQFSYYSEEMTTSAVARLELGNHLRNALANGELHVHYQPQVDLASGKILGAEALMRWVSPTLGTVSPARFIPLAEDLGCIVAMGEWILRSVCLQGKLWLDAGYALQSLAVNLSAVQFYQTDIVQCVASILEQTGYPAERLELEVTESLLMHKEQETITRLHQLHQLGVRLSIDDFGTGYSSLSYLKFFPLQGLKIDKSFINDLPQGAADCKMVTAIIQMGQGLGLKLLAEGVERPEQLNYLKNSGCDLYQGYLCSKALPAPEFIGLLEEPCLKGDQA